MRTWWPFACYLFNIENYYIGWVGMTKCSSHLRWEALNLSGYKIRGGKSTKHFKDYFRCIVKHEYLMYHLSILNTHLLPSSTSPRKVLGTDLLLYKQRPRWRDWNVLGKEDSWSVEMSVLFPAASHEMSFGPFATSLWLHFINSSSAWCTVPVAMPTLSVHPLSLKGIYHFLCKDLLVHFL